MADISSEVAFRVTQTGAAETRKAFEDIAQTQKGVAQAAGDSTIAQKAHGDATNKVTQFVREQRTEQRTQNYLFREAKDAIGTVTFGFMALSSSMGNASESNRKLNQTLVTGYSAFQAADFAMAGLGLASGGTALAIAGLVGGGAALLMFLDDSKSKLAETSTQMRLLSKESDVFNSVLENRTKRLDTLSDKRLTSELNVRLGILTDIEKKQETIRRTLEGGGASEEQKKTLEGGLAILEKRHAVEWSLLQGIIKEREERASILGIQKQKIELLKEELEKAQSLQDIQRLNLELSKEEVRLSALKRGSGEEIFRPGALTPLGVTGPTDLIPRKLPIGFPGKLKPVDLKEVDIWKTLSNEVDKSNAKELIFLSLLDQGVGTLRSAVDFLGISTDSLVGKLLQGLDIALSIMKMIKAFSAIGTVVSAYLSGGTSLIPAVVGGITKSTKETPTFRQAEEGESTTTKSTRETPTFRQAELVFLGLLDQGIGTLRGAVDFKSTKEAPTFRQVEEGGFTTTNIDQPPSPVGDILGGFTKGDRSRRKAMADFLRADDIRLEKEAKALIAETDKANAQQLVFLGMLDQGIGTLRGAVDFLGISTDSFIGKLLQRLDIAMSIAKTIRAFSAMETIGGTSLIAEAVKEITKSTNRQAEEGYRSRTRTRNDAGIETKETPTFRQAEEGGSTNINITIQAIDAQSIDRMLANPDNARVFVRKFDDYARKGKSNS